MWDRAERRDGHVSFEVPASLAFDADKTIEAAQRYKAEIDRPNVLIKVPGTGDGVRAFEELTALGVNVNVTLLFAVERYEEIAEAFLKGLERRVEAGESIDKSASVASFFVSRVDSKVDEALEGTDREDLTGKAAVANARIAYESFQRIFSGPRWEALAAKGARVQRPLWASTSTKNPDYSDTLYVDELIGPDTVNTMPDKTIEAARDHATAARTVDQGFDEAHQLIEAVKAAGVDFDRIVQHELVDEGVKSFSDSYDSLLESIKEKASDLVHAAYSRARSGRSRSGEAAGRAEGGLKRAAYLLDRDHAAQDAFAVDGHKGAEASQRLGGQELGDRPVLAHAPAVVLLGLEHGLDGQPVLSATLGGVDPLLAGDPEEPPGVVDHREPGPAVAQEELVEGVGHGRTRGDRHRLAVHDVGHPHAFDPGAQGGLDDRRAAPTGRAGRRSRSATPR